MPKFWLLLPCFLLGSWIGPCNAKGTLEGPLRIGSKALGYDLQYWVYLPENAPKSLPELYVTDGQVYLGAGEMVDILDREIEEGNIVPIAVVFVDSRDPDDLTESRRNNQFMCNANYGKFFIGELMPRVSAKWTGADSSTWRGIMGFSIGGINAACFGMMMPGVFQVLIMQSPASDAHLEVVNQLYSDKPPNGSAVFLSHGGPADYAAAAEQFIETLREKNYAVRQISNDGGHDWDNWRPLIDDALRAFAGTREEDEIQ